MNNARMALMVTGMAFILMAAAVLYYQTDLRNEIPEGVALAILLVLIGLCVLAFASEFRRTRYYASRPIVQSTYVRDVDVDHVDPEPRLASRRGSRREHIEERIER